MNAIRDALNEAPPRQKKPEWCTRRIDLPEINPTLPSSQGVLAFGNVAERRLRVLGQMI